MKCQMKIDGKKCNNTTLDKHSKYCVRCEDLLLEAQDTLQEQCRCNEAVSNGKEFDSACKIHKQDEQEND